MKRAGAAAALCVCLAGFSLAAHADDAGGYAAGAAAANAHETVVVRVSLNSVTKEDVFAERVGNGDFLLPVADLKAIGFKEPVGSAVTIAGKRYLSLRSIAGVHYVFNEDDLTLKITADPKLLTTQNLDFLSRRKLPADVAPADSSAFVNYALTTTNMSAKPSRPGFSGEFGWRWRDYLFASDAASVVADEASGRRRLVRLMTSVTHDDRQALRRVVVGDFFTPTREVSLGVNLGGLSISKLYGLDPTFVQFPMQNVSGAVSLPTQMELYVDGQRVRTEQLKPGGFQVSDILAYAGARDVQVVLRDPFGRVQQLTYSFYFSDQALRQGLQEYSYNVGALRRQYGTESNRYGPVAFSLYHRFGLTNALTVGARAEGTRELLNGGPTVTAVLSGAGVVNLAASASSAAGLHGAAVVGSYTYASNVWGAGASLRRDWGRYASLADPITISNRNYEATGSVSYRLGTRGTLSLSHSVFRARGDTSPPLTTGSQVFALAGTQDHRATRLTYTVPLVPGWVTLTATGGHLKDALRGSYNEVFVGLTIFLGGGYSGSTSVRRDPAYGTQSVQLVKQQPLGEGLGFVVGADRNTDPAGSADRVSGTVQYNAPTAVWRADVDRNRDEQGVAHDDYQLSVAGGLAYVGGTVAAGRPITGSYAVVKTGQLAGVGVKLNGQRMGATNADGTLFLPNLSPYVVNDVSLVPDTVPIEYTVSSLAKRFVPPVRSGSLVDFAMTRLQAFTGNLVTRLHGAATTPVEYADVHLEGGPEAEDYQTGHGGEFYFENLKPGAYHGRAVTAAGACVFQLKVPASDQTFLDLGHVDCRPEQRSQGAVR